MDDRNISNDGDAAAASESVRQEVPYRSGFVAVVGRPNVGKSTLINALIGKQIAIASSRPETTRKAIRGILTTDNAQLVLVDTPGIHRPRTLLGQRLNDVVEESLSDVDVVAFLLPADQEIGPGDKRILSRLRTDFATKREDGSFAWRIPLIAIVTKIDELGRQQLINKLIEINEFADFADIVPVSALKHDNLAEVRNVLIDHTPEGPQMYPDDQISEERPEDTIAELVRGAFLETLDDELPHSLAVVVDSIDYPEDNETGQPHRRPKSQARPPRQGRQRLAVRPQATRTPRLLGIGLRPVITKGDSNGISLLLYSSPAYFFLVYIWVLRRVE